MLFTLGIGWHFRERLGHTHPMSGPRVELRVLEHLGGLAPEWDALAARQPLPSPFLRSWWIEHAAAGDPVLLCWFAEGDHLVGGAAFERDRPGWGALSVERLRCLGQGVLAPDHLDLIAEEPYRDAVLRSLMGWLFRPGSRVIDLDGLAEDGTIATSLAAHRIGREAAPYATLPQDHEEYLAARPGRLRSTIGRTGRRLQRAGAIHRQVEVDEAGRGLDDLSRLHEGRWAEESEFLHGWQRFRAAAMAGMRAGEVTIDEIVTEGGEVVATELDMVVADRTYFYQAGRDLGREWRGAGSVLRDAIVERAIAKGHAEYDLLRGDEPYKADWSEHRRHLVRCRVGVGPLGRAAVAFAHLLARGAELRRRMGPAIERLSRAASRRGRSPRSEQRC